MHWAAEGRLVTSKHLKFVTNNSAGRTLSYQSAFPPANALYCLIYQQSRASSSPPGFSLSAEGMEIWKLYLDIFSILQQQGYHGDAGKDGKVGMKGERKLE